MSDAAHGVRTGWWVAAARLANAVFFLLTATYCILTYSSFAYQQFIRPRLVSSLSGFVAFHHLWHWVFLGITVATLLPEWKTSRGRVVAWTYVGAMTLVGFAILYKPVLPSVENDSLGLWLAGAFLVPPIWLAWYDHLATARAFAPSPVDVRRLVVALAAASVVVWAVNAASSPLRFGDLGDYTTTPSALIFGAVVSLAVHAGIFTLLGVLLAAALSPGRRAASGALHYRVLALVGFGFALLVMKDLVFGPLSFTGLPSWLMALLSAAAMTGTWSAAAKRLSSGLPVAPTALDAWLSPVPGARTAIGACAGLVLLPIGLFLLLQRVEKFDWDFLVQNLVVLAGWMLTTAFVHALVHRTPGSTRTRPVAVVSLAIMAAAGVGAGGTIETRLPGSQQFVPEFVLDAYATVDPSYRLMRQFLSVEPTGSTAFFAYLGAHSLIQHVDVKPVDVDLVRPLLPAPSKPPHIFFFVIDSLRRDYVSAYNPTVTFTPAFAQFAREDLAFQRSFTRYGGTGLSMPAIWAGSMILHKEYVLPFQPMNALEKLVTANHYRVMMSLDHITTQIVSPTLPVEELDKGRDEMQYDFCATLEELQRRLEAGVPADRPIFAHTRSLNLHISKLTERVGAPDPAYGGFQAPAAAAVRRMDGCFGRFIDSLKRTGLYDDSIVVLTSDHGDALGEAKRWGHAYTLYPEIVRTPLLVHVPARLRSRFTTDLEAPSFSTDITPSLYALLGYHVESQEWPIGRSLFVPQGESAPPGRSEPALIASSYGPVYGVLRDKGRSLYIADGVNRRDYAYDVSGLKPVRVGVTEAMRSNGRTFIHDSLARLASIYRFTPAP